MLNGRPVIVYCSSSNAECRQGDQASSVIIFHIDYYSVFYLISFTRTVVQSCHSLLDCRHTYETLMIPAKQVCTMLQSHHRIGKFVIYL